MKRSVHILTLFLSGLILLCACTAKQPTEQISEEAVTLTQEQRSILKRTIQARNEKAPYTFGTIGMIRYLELKGQHMRMFVDVCQHFYNIKKIKENPEVIKTTLKDNLGILDDSLDPLFYILAEYRIGLRIELGHENDEEVMDVYFTPEELMELSRTKQRDVKPSQILKNHAAAYNLSLPELVYPRATLNQVEVNSKDIIYHFTIEESDHHEMHRIRAGKMLWGAKILKQLKESKDSGVREVMRICRQAKRSFAYRFTGDKTGIQVTINFHLEPDV